MPAGKLMAQIRARIERACCFKGLPWQTIPRGKIDPQRLSGALANRHHADYSARWVLRAGGAALAGGASCGGTYRPPARHAREQSRSQPVRPPPAWAALGDGASAQAGVTATGARRTYLDLGPAHGRRVGGRLHAARRLNRVHAPAAASAMRLQELRQVHGCRS
jgi:hypothetical protein